MHGKGVWLQGLNLGVINLFIPWILMLLFHFRSEQLWYLFKNPGSAVVHPVVANSVTFYKIT